MRVEGNVVANLNQTHSSTNEWTISYPIPLVTVKKGADYTCVVTMGPRINISALAQLAGKYILYICLSRECICSSICSIRSTPVDVIGERTDEDTDVQCNGLSYTDNHVAENDRRQVNERERQRSY